MNLLIGSSHPAPQRPCRAPRPCPARLRRVGGRVEKRGVTVAGRGSGIGWQLESPRNAPSGCEARCDRRKGRGSPAGLRLLFLPVSNLAACCWDVSPLSVEGYTFTLPLCVSVSSDQLRGLQASFLNSWLLRWVPLFSPRLPGALEVRPAPSERMREP